jgi:hypothetical protein
MPPTTIKAIETRYAGYRFRSRLEARYAVFFDALHLPWEYEEEGFVLGAVGHYLPDFWLPTLSLWIEIKGPPPTDEERAKARALAEHTIQDVAILAGPPTTDDDEQASILLYRYYRLIKTPALVHFMRQSPREYGGTERVEALLTRGGEAVEFVPPAVGYRDLFGSDLDFDTAVEDARSARF